MTTYRIEAIDPSGLRRLTRLAFERPVADRLYSEAIEAYPGCEVRLLDGDIPLVTAGPRRPR